MNATHTKGHGLRVLTAALWALGLVVGPAAELPAVSQELQFRGVSQEGQVCLVCVYDRAAKLSHWIPVNGQAQGISVRSYDAKEDKVVVTRAGKVMTLPLIRASITHSQRLPGIIKADGTANLDFINVDETDDTDDSGKDASRVVPLSMRKLPLAERAMLQEYFRRRAINNATDAILAGDVLPPKKKP